MLESRSVCVTENSEFCKSVSMQPNLGIPRDAQPDFRCESFGMKDSKERV